MAFIIGERLKNVVTGKAYRIRLVGERMVVLESFDEEKP